MLTVYDPATGTHKNYVPATDRCLRESADPNSPCLPPFHHETQDRRKDACLNVFLVALNAGIKFSQYFQGTGSHPPTKPLPDRILTLMRRTIELVELIYWEPVVTKCSGGKKMVSKRSAEGQKNLKRAAMGDHAESIERGPSEETETEMEDEDMQDPITFRVASSRRRQFWPADMDLETRMAHGRALMCGHGALLFPLSLRIVNLKLHLPRL